LQSIHTEKSFLKLVKSHQNQIVFIIFPIYLEPNGISIGSKLIEEWYTQSDFGLNQHDSEKVFCHQP